MSHNMTLSTGSHLSVRAVQASRVARSAVSTRLALNAGGRSQRDCWTAVNLVHDARLKVQGTRWVVCGGDPSNPVVGDPSVHIRRLEGSCVRLQSSVADLTESRTYLKC